MQTPRPPELGLRKDLGLEAAGPAALPAVLGSGGLPMKPAPYELSALLAPQVLFMSFLTCSGHRPLH